MKTKGAYSYSKISLSELNAKLGSGAMVVVSRKWAEANSLQGESALSTTLNPVIKTVAPIAAATPVASPVSTAVPEVAPVVEIV